MTSHIIVYLDQSYLSNMAKARFGFLGTEEDTNFWQSLFDELKKVVLADKIACPKLEFHDTETMYAKRLERAIREVIDELSWGLQFRPYESILESQIEDTARKFLGKQPEGKEPWAIAFESNPQAPVKSRMQNILGTKGRINVHFSLPDEIVAQDRQLKLKSVNVIQKALNKYIIHNPPHDLSEAIVQSKKSFVEGFMGIQAKRSIAQKLQGDSRDRLVALERYYELMNLWNQLHYIGINIHDAKIVMNFTESEEFLNIPFIDIFGSIYAVIAMHYPKIQTGHLYDVPILATALPYCDVVTTDKFMKEILVKILHLDDKYKAKIFSPTKADRLAFQKFVGGL